MGASNSKNDSETINWNNIKTENVSSSMPNLNSLSKEAKQLIASLNIPEITETQTSEFTVNHILDTINTNLNKEDKQKFSAILDQVSSQTNSEELSNTSPFISSEMYDYLVNSKTSEDKKQVGGAKNKKSKVVKVSKSKATKSKRGGSLDDNDSDTSSTSSDSELEDILDSTEEEILKEKKEKNKDKKNKKHMKEESDSEMSGGELSYLSSSAHTDGDFSQSGSESSVSKTSHTSIESDSESNNNSVTDENKDMLTTSVSVNTDDINMVSDY